MACCRRTSHVTYPLTTGPVPQTVAFLPDCVLKWAAVWPGLPWPADAVALGSNYDGSLEFLARARLGDGSLRPGRIAQNVLFTTGCRIACTFVADV
jgi:hypothetical protein